MKAERYTLIAAGALVSFQVARMIMGVIGLARHQGAFALLALVEVGALAAAGIIPMVVAFWRKADAPRWLVAVWAVCAGYAVLLALNAFRLGYYSAGAPRLALWMVITVLFVRVLRRRSGTPELPVT